MTDWTDKIPQAAREYLIDRRLDEVECVVAERQGLPVADHGSRQWQLPARYFAKGCIW